MRAFKDKDSHSISYISFSQEKQTFKAKNDYIGTNIKVKWSKNNSIKIAREEQSLFKAIVPRI
jgi:hypothetical protein